MDKPMSAREVEDRIARLVAEQTAQVLWDLDRIEGRLDLVKRTIRRQLDA